jgi:hypothetical protein
LLVFRVAIFAPTLVTQPQLGICKFFPDNLFNIDQLVPKGGTSQFQKGPVDVERGQYPRQQGNKPETTFVQGRRLLSNIAQKCSEPTITMT